jgi:hypothetical protein
MTGDYTDPISREPLSDETLLRLDIFGRRLNKSSVIEARNDRSTKYAEQKVQRDTISCLDSVIGDCVSEMYDALESVNEGRETIEEATVHLLTSVTPLLEESFKQLVTVDAESARLTVLCMESFLRGPRQRPSKDRFNFLPILLEMFHVACGQT